MNLVTIDSGAYISHGIKWRHHKYIRKEGDRYIYPDKYNDPNATVFGDRMKRNTVKAAKRLVSGFEQNRKKLVSAALKYQNKATSEAVKATDYTKSDLYRRKHAKKAEAYTNKYNTAISDISTTDANLAAGREAYEKAMDAYNRSRLVDDLPRKAVETGKAWLDKLFRKKERE